MELRAHGVVPGAINIPVGYINEGCRTFQPQIFQPYIMPIPSKNFPAFRVVQLELAGKSSPQM